MSPHPYTEDQLVEQPAIALLSLELNRRPTRAHGEWLRLGRAMGERVALLAAGV